MNDTLMKAGLNLRESFHHYARMEQFGFGVTAVTVARADFDRMMHAFFLALEQAETTEAVEESEQRADAAEARREMAMEGER
jgi:hypothetical protein